MAWRPHARAQVNPMSPRAWATCDQCGINYNLENLRWQYQYNGITLVNQRFLVCEQCWDKPADFLQAVLLPPDPMPILDPRPEPYAIDESGATQTLNATIRTSEATITDFYLDLYDGDPTASGTSVLSTITGSATRTDFSGSMSAPSNDISTNDTEISFTGEAASSALVSYLAVFDAAADGTLLMSGALNNPQTVVRGNACVFEVGDLFVALNVS